MGRVPTLTTFQSDDEVFNRYQAHVKQALGPALANPLLAAVDFRWTEVAAATPGLPTFALQYRSTGSTWNTVATFDSTGALVQQAWVAPTLGNSWVAYGTYATAQCMKDSLGFVRLRGLIKSGTLNTVAFTLPVGMRPAVPILTWGAAGNNAGLIGFNRIDIATSGAVTIGLETSGSYNGYQSIEGITFDTRS